MEHLIGEIIDKDSSENNNDDSGEEDSSESNKSDKDIKENENDMEKWTIIKNWSKFNKWW